MATPPDPTWGSRRGEDSTPATIYCPRCGAQNDGRSNACGACSLPLTEITSIVTGRGEREHWRRLAVTLLIFIAAPWLALKWGESRNNEFYKLLAGFLFVLLLPGLPWIVSAILNRSPRRR
jgi:hypothetical protein